MKSSSNRPLLRLVALVLLIPILGFCAFVVWNSVLKPRFATIGQCDAEAGCLFTVNNGNRSVDVAGVSAETGQFVTDGSAGGFIHDGATGDRQTKLDVGTINHRYVVGGDQIAALTHINPTIQFFNFAGESLGSWTFPLDERLIDFAFVPLADGFATTSAESGVVFWSLADGSEITRLDGTQGVGEIATSADGRVLVGVQPDSQQILIWPIEQLSQVTRIADVAADEVVVSAEGAQFASHDGASAAVWQTADGQVLFTTPIDETVPITSIALSPDGTRLAVGDQSGIVTVFAVADGSALAQLPHSRPIGQMAFGDGGTQLLVGLNHDAELVSAVRVGLLPPTQSTTVTDPGFAIAWQLD